MSVLCHVCGDQLEVVEFCIQCSPPQDEPHTDPTPAALDLVGEARYSLAAQDEHCCCAQHWIPRLADALEQAQELANNLADRILEVNQERDAAQADAAEQRKLVSALRYQFIQVILPSYTALYEAAGGEPDQAVMSLLAERALEGVGDE